MRKLRLFCFPYAGGSSVVYNSWEDQLGDHIQLYPVELAGRGKRINEPPYTSPAEAAADVIRKIKHRLFDAPFAFYGHSMGGAIAYMTALQLRNINYPQPKHIFFSGRGVPHIIRQDRQPYHTLPDDVFREKVMALGGTPRELFEHPELLEIMIPLLRADFRLSWVFTHEFGEIKPLDCDFTVLTGKDEDLLPEQIDEWALHTNKKCNFYRFDGGHFFINDPESKKKVIEIINKTFL